MKLYYPSDSSFLYKSLMFATLLATSIILFEIQLLTTQPWTGLVSGNPLNDNNGNSESVIINAVEYLALQESIQAGDHIIAIKSANYPYLPVSPQQLNTDPEQTGSFTSLNRIYATNTALYQRLTDQGALTLKMANAEEVMLTLQPDRPLYSLHQFKVLQLFKSRG